MKKLMKLALTLSLALAVLAALGGVLLWQEIASHPHVSISINGDDVALAELSAAHWGSLLFALGLTLLLLLVLLPLLLLLGIGLPLMMVTGAVVLVVAVVLGIGALIGSPLILLLLLLWWLLRRKPAPPYKPQEPSGPVAPQ